MMISNGRWRLCLASLVMAQFSSGMQITLIYSSFPTLRRVFPDAIASGWIIMAYLLVSAVSAAIFSRLGDLLGRRIMLRLVLAVTCTGAVISASSSQLSGVILGTTLQGLCGAIIPLCFGLARENSPPDRVPSAIGAIIAAGVVGGFGGMVLGGLMVDLWGWRMVFITGAFFFSLGLVLVSVFVPASKADKPSLAGFDFLGAILFIPGITGILYAVSQAASRGWTDPQVLVILLASILLQGCWFWHELRHPKPLISVRLLFGRQIFLANICIACVAVGTMQVGQIMPIYFQQPAWTSAGFGLSASLTGTLLGLLNLVGLIAGPWAGRLVERRGSRAAMLFSSCIVIVAWLWILIWSDSLSIVMTSLLVNAFGLTACYTVISSLIVEAAPLDRTSEASGLMVVTRALMMVIGAQFILLILTLQPLDSADHGAPLVAHSGFMGVFGLVFAASIGCLLSACFLPKPVRLTGEQSNRLVAIKP